MTRKRCNAVAGLLIGTAEARPFSINSVAKGQVAAQWEQGSSLRRSSVASAACGGVNIGRKPQFLHNREIICDDGVYVSCFCTGMLVCRGRHFKWLSILQFGVCNYMP